MPVAAVGRLRKLRQAEEEEALPGDVYIERLRGEFALFSIVFFLCFSSFLRPSAARVAARAGAGYGGVSLRKIGRGFSARLPRVAQSSTES